MPDNAGPDGVVGSLLEGRWYGGHYGWSWPHGWYSVGSAAAVAALAAATVTGDDGYLDLVRPALDAVIAHGTVLPFAESDSSIPSKWYPQLGPAVTVPTLLVPFRHSDRGWFDYNPVLASVPMALWHHASDPADRQRLEDLRRRSGYDWRTVRSFRSKEEAGHEEPWFTFLAGDNPDYPEKVLAAAQAQARHRLARMRAYRGGDVAEADIHLWQQSQSRSSPRPWCSSPGAARKSSTTEACSRPGSATTMPSAAALGSLPAWPPWYRASTRRPRSSNWSTSTREANAG